MKSFTLVAHDFGTDFTATFSLTSGSSSHAGVVTFSKNHLLNVLSDRHSNMLNAAKRLESVQAAYDYLKDEFHITKIEK